MKMNGMTFKGMFAGESTGKKILVYVFALIFCTVFFSALGVIITKIGIWPKKSVEAAKILQLFSSVGVFLMPPILFVYLTKKDSENYFQMNMVDPRILIYGICAIITIFPLICVLGAWNEGMHFPEALQGVETWMKAAEDEAKRLTLLFLETHTIPGLIGNLILIALIPALGEELTFRGVLQQSLTKHLKNGHAAVWISAFIFSAIHMQFYGFFPRFVLGALLGYLFLYGKSLIVSIFCHFMNNAVVVIFAYTSSPSKALENETFFSMTNGTIAASVLLLGLTYLIFKRIIKIGENSARR